MRKSTVSVNREAETIEVSKSFYKKASIFGTAECRMLAEAQQMFPTFEVEVRVSTKKTYGGLSFERMRAYIETQPNSVQRLNEFESVQRVAKAKGALYPRTKKWFLRTYPEYKDSGVSESELSELLDTLASEDDDSLPMAVNM